MGLSVVQSLLIGGGKAADVIRASDVRKSKEYNDAFNSFIDNNVGALKKASAKQSLLTNRMKKDISQIINTYFNNSIKYLQNSDFNLAFKYSSFFDKYKKYSLT